MSANDSVSFRIDPLIRKEAAAVLEKEGLSVSDFCRMALTRVAHEGRVPFSDDIPNALTRETIEKMERGEDLHYVRDADDLFRQLGI